MKKILKERKVVEQAITWDLTAIYATEEKFECAVNELKELALKIEKDYKGKLTTANKINECLDKLRKLYQLKDLTSSYVELSVSVDYTNNENQDKYSKMINIIADIESRLSFIESEIIQVNDEVLDAAISASKENSNYLKDKKREKEYALHPEVERVLAALSGTLEGPYKVYEQAKHTDMNFKSFL